MPQPFPLKLIDEGYDPTTAGRLIHLADRSNCDSDWTGINTYLHADNNPSHEATPHPRFLDHGKLPSGSSGSGPSVEESEKASGHDRGTGSGSTRQTQGEAGNERLVGEVAEEEEAGTEILCATGAVDGAPDPRQEGGADGAARAVSAPEAAAEAIVGATAVAYFWSCKWVWEASSPWSTWRVIRAAFHPRRVVGRQRSSRRSVLARVNGCGILHYFVRQSA
ncbi:hypothetical protein BAUCODRAFT_573234 [Baudoinia panamericana UAMH 10762]|uniref:Uncharacterized protein n=1 Tax=Baudoinia panamericana (strain UAMH 10762) TaxID=717646 RepID=M2NIR8_BAUPA|nr:uncharacterized protein BAUCODRAFT_573234 [Baudoinia panamericana UAMH 10762]EMC98985.1 hypothetical protein BAUCODRAFT_573234 [Baudoinia panamericana UAMH 10762]